MPARVKILFNTWADARNLNAQSLTAREIALRLDPTRFESSLFLSWSEEADARLADRENVRFLRVPPRLGSVYIAAQLLWGKHDILFYPSLNPRARGLQSLLRGAGRRCRIIENVECSIEQIKAADQKGFSRLARSLKTCDRCFGITPQIAEGLKRELGVSAGVIPLGVDLNLFAGADRGDHSLPVRVVYVASVQPRKQTHLMLDLARRFAGDPVEFHIIGPTLFDPGYRRGLEEEARGEALDNVHFHGGMVQSELVRWLHSCDIYVLPSRLEGFGKTTIEAAATGLPAVIFDDYCSTAVVDNITGFQVKTFEEFHERVHRLVADKALRLRMGEAAALHARLFSWEKIVEKWKEVFLEMSVPDASTGRGRTC